MVMFGVGVDPGTTGAIAVVERTANGSKVHGVWSMPIIMQGKEKRVHGRSLLIILETIDVLYGPSLVTLERVASMPQQGVASVFTFGMMYGAAGAAIEIALPNARVERPSPSEWKKAMKVADGTMTKAEKKNASRLRATDIFGKDALMRWWPNVGSADFAEAALIAEYGMMGLQDNKGGTYGRR